MGYDFGRIVFFVVFFLSSFVVRSLVDFFDLMDVIKVGGEGVVLKYKYLFRLGWFEDRWVGRRLVIREVWILLGFSALGRVWEWEEEDLGSLC